MSGAGLELFAATAPGLEALAAAELQALGAAPAVEQGGVAWRGDTASMYAANLHLRTASRVLLRIGSFRARTFFELERHAGRVAWAEHIAPGTRAALRVTSRKSKLYHEGAIAERVLTAIARSVPGVEVLAAAAEEEESDGAAQLFVIRFLRDACTISVDTSGDLLHRRGYRQALAKAPLRETLAAAALAASGWTEAAPLIDPMCGSGTIPIEAALRSRRIPPGMANAELAPRDFAFQRRPDYESGLWERVVSQARAAVRPHATAPIVGSDRDAGAVEAARRNAERAGVTRDVVFERRSVSALEPVGRGAFLVTNPPYGVRVGEARPLRDLFAALGRVARERLPGGRIALLSADPRFESAVGLPFDVVLATRNGGIPVRLVVADIASTGAQDTVEELEA